MATGRDGTTSGEAAHGARAPLQIVEALGLDTAVDVAAMAARTCAFKGVHMGERDLPIGTLLDLIGSDAELCPPRTGHIGNWGNIARGRAGAMDFNKAICAAGHGYPLLYYFTQTEADTPQQGDWGYLPGSIVDGDVRTPLQLHAWDGTEFAPCSHVTPRFTPFVQAKVEGQLQPLIELHARRLEPIGPHPFKLEQALLANRETMVRPLVEALVDDARRRDNPRRALQDLISHSVALDGTMTRSDLMLDGRGFKIGETYYPSTEALVEHALMLFRAVADPRSFIAGIHRLPPQLPVPSNLLIALLSAVLETHKLGAPSSTSPDAGSINFHLHWGGRDMAGVPPYKRGYLLEASKIRSMKRMCTTLVARFPEVRPLCFVLLPAIVFMLCPTSAHPEDAEALATLFTHVRNASAGEATSEPSYGQLVEGVVSSWQSSQETKLSDYFQDRFGPRRGGLVPVDFTGSHPVEPAGFRDLTLRQASMIVGALYAIHAASRAHSRAPP